MGNYSTVANIGSGGASTSSFVYDKNGDLKTVNYATNNVAIHAVNFVTDSTGQVIARTDRNVGATTGPTDYYDRFGGQAMSQVGNDGTADFDDATAIARRSPTPGNLYRNGGAQVINTHHKSSTFRSMTPTRGWATWPAQVNTSIPVAQRRMGLNRAFWGCHPVRLPAWGEGGREADG